MDDAYEEIERAEYRLPEGASVLNLLDSRDGRETLGLEANDFPGQNRQLDCEKEAGGGSAGRASVRGSLEFCDVVVAASVWVQLLRLLR